MPNAHSDLHPTLSVRPVPCCGDLAYLTGHSASSNPHKRGSKRADEWLELWNFQAKNHGRPTVSADDVQFLHDDMAESSAGSAPGQNASGVTREEMLSALSQVEQTVVMLRQRIAQMNASAIARSNEDVARALAETDQAIAAMS